MHLIGSCIDQMLVIERSDGQAVLQRAAVAGEGLARMAEGAESLQRRVTVQLERDGRLGLRLLEGGVGAQLGLGPLGRRLHVQAASRGVHGSDGAARRHRRRHHRTPSLRKQKPLESGTRRSWRLTRQVAYKTRTLKVLGGSIGDCSSGSLVVDGWRLRLPKRCLEDTDVTADADGGGDSLGKEGSNPGDEWNGRRSKDRSRSEVACEVYLGT